ncbi:MAG: hypothetical protein GWP61_01680 [Chloroflexi bacterium]|jgi:hypothetical protein|nr:hypothetical protein [Chloroflexota bacterium]
MPYVEDHYDANSWYAWERLPRYPDFYFAHPGEIRPLMESAGSETLILIGCEGIVAGREEAINQVEGEL